MYGYGYSYPNNTQGSGLMGNYEAGVRTDGGFFAFPIDTGLASRLEALGLLNASSLVNSCNAGKADVLYNLIPTPVQALDRFTVTRSTVKRVLNSSGVLAEVAINTPAFEFNANGTYRGLLVEPAGTNLALRSEEFGNAYWSKVNLTVSDNAGVSPDGATTADKLIPSTGVGVQQRIDRVTTTTNAVHTWSVFAKNDGYNFLSLRIGSLGAAINLTTGALNTPSVGFTAVSQALPNGWFRLSVSGTAALNDTVRINVESSLSISTNMQGNGTDGVLIWGAQLETGAVATSYIPTVASTANRTADSVTLTGASSLIGQTEGTFYFEFQASPSGASSNWLNISDGTVNNWLFIGKDGDKARGYIRANNVVILSDTSFTLTGASIKVALAYKSGDYALYINGNTVASGTTAFTFSAALTGIQTGAQTASAVGNASHYRSFALFPTRLTTAQANALTAL